MAECRKNKYEKYVADFNVKSFREKLSDAEFENNLREVIDNGNRLFEKVISIIKFENDNYPVALIKQLITQNLDITFNLLVYLDKNIDDNVSNISPYFNICLWFHTNNKNIGEKLFSELSTNTWEQSYNNLADKKVVLKLIEPNIFSETINNLTVTNLKVQNLWANEDLKPVLRNHFSDAEPENLLFHKHFVNKITANKAFLLFVQRNYINEKFKDFNQFENLEDSNKPWDYDHIYPISWVYKEHNIDQIVRDWVNCIGNYRVLSFDDNRSESNRLSPFKRLEIDDKKTDSFILENDLVFWNSITNEVKRNNVDSKQTQMYLSAIVTRMCNIYEDWYRNYLKFN